MFLTFLKENILNGRVTPQFNNFTFVSPHRGSSVPDYIFCPVDHLDYCKTVKTLLMSEVVNMFGIQPPQNLPDHSIIFSHFETSQFDISKYQTNKRFLNSTKSDSFVPPSRPPKKNIKKCNPTFL